MKKLTSIILIFFLSLLSSPSWSESFDELEERDGIYYKKFSDAPFSGEISGIFSYIDTLYQGSMKDGKREGEWVFYHDNGQLWQKGVYKNGKSVGEWVIYNRYGTLLSKRLAN